MNTRLTIAIVMQSEWGTVLFQAHAYRKPTVLFLVYISVRILTLLSFWSRCLLRALRLLRLFEVS